MKELMYKPLGNIKRSYRQDKFIISTFKINGRNGVDLSYDDAKRIVKNLKKAHHNQIELCWTTEKTISIATRVCNEENIDLIIQNMNLFGGFQNRESVNVTEEDVKKIVELYGKEACVKGYYVWDEPFTEEGFSKTKEQTDWFYKYAPGTLVFSVYNPNYNPRYTWENGLYPEYAKTFLDIIEPPVVSFDFYPFGAPPMIRDTEEQLDNSLLWKDIEVARREALNRDMPFWFYYSCALTHASYESRIEKNQIRFQIYNALMYGAKALQSYGVNGCGCGPLGYDEDRKMLEFDGQEGYFFEEVKDALGVAENWSRTLMALTSEHIYHDNELLKDDEFFNENYREDIMKSDIFDEAALPHRCSVGVFKDDYNNKYIMVFNRDYREKKSFKLKLKEDSRLYEVSKEDGKQRFTGTTDVICVDLEPAVANLYRIDTAKAETEEIEYICVS